MVLIERLFEKGRPVKLLVPFNLAELETVDCTTNYFDNTIYNLCVKNKKSLNYCHNIERGFVRTLVTLYDCKECKNNISSMKNFGGFGYKKIDTDEDMQLDFYFDYYDGEALEFNSAIKKIAAIDFTASNHTIIKVSLPNWDVKAICIDKYGCKSPYLVKTRANDDSNRHSASAMIYAFTTLCYLIGNDFTKGTNKALDIITNHINDAVTGMESCDYPLVLNAMRALDADIYTFLKYPLDVKNELEEENINVDAFDSDEFSVLDEEIPSLDVFYGNSDYLNGTLVSKPKTTKVKLKTEQKTIAELIATGTFSLGRELTESEERLIPSHFSTFIPSEKTLSVAKHIKFTSGKPIPCRNIMWTGETGTGKTTEAQMLATLLHEPYYSMNLSSDKLSSDILVSCLPNSNTASKEDISNTMESFPDATLIAINPKEAFKMLTGEDKEDATEKDVILAESERLYEVAKRANDFMYVESPFVTAFRNGGVVELQEVNSCKAAILKSLNEALDDLQLIHLPTGEIIHRHPNCVVVVTANIGSGYEGVNKFSNDFTARFQWSDVFKLPNDDALADRVILRSGYKDKPTVLKMIKVMHAMQRVLLEEKGDYGSCSPRGLIAWATAAESMDDVYEACKVTLLGLSSQDPEIQALLLHALETEFVSSSTAY